MTAERYLEGNSTLLAQTRSKYETRALLLLTKAYDSLLEFLELEKKAQAEAGTDGCVLQSDEMPVDEALRAIVKYGAWHIP